MTDKEELRYRGLLGHTVVVLTTGGGSLETCDLPSARRYADENAEHDPRIWKRAGKGWRRVAYKPAAPESMERRGG